MDTNNPSSSLWRNPDFLKLWGGETVSLFGSTITTLALPLVAALSLDATALEMGYLNTARFVPFLLFTLVAGVWVDRYGRRPVVIAANVGRALLMGIIPALAFAGQLAMGHLYAIIFLVGILTVFFDLAFWSYLPALVSRDNLVEANSKLQASASVAEVGGPGVGGLLVEFLSAPFAILIDALSFVVSALALWLIRTAEPLPTQPDTQRHLLREIREGIQVTFGNPYLRAIAGEAATYNLFWTATNTVFVLYATRTLGLSPGLLGFVVATGSAGALVGAMIARSLGDRLGSGPTLVLAMVVACLVPILVPLVTQATFAGLALLITSHFLGGIGVAVSNVFVVSLRQTVTPDHLLGRMMASYRMVIYGTMPLGALLAGWVGEAYGLRTALLVSAAGYMTAPLWVVFSPVPRLRDLIGATTAG